MVDRFFSHLFTIAKLNEPSGARIRYRNLKLISCDDHCELSLRMCVPLCVN